MTSFARPSEQVLDAIGLPRDSRTVAEGHSGGCEPERAIEVAALAGLTVRQSRAMASFRKPVIVRKFSRDWCAGYAAQSFGQDEPELEILDLTGKVLRIAWDQVKWVCYVRDFSVAETANPERLLHKRFSTRPRAAGVWLGSAGSQNTRPSSIDNSRRLEMATRCV